MSPIKINLQSRITVQFRLGLKDRIRVRLMRLMLNTSGWLANRAVKMGENIGTPVVFQVVE